MTQKRKAELQRKLSMAPVAKPPSGLAERIKADIPQYLRPERDRDRFTQSWAFTLRVAASIILLVTSVFLTMQLISRDGDVLRVDTPERGAVKTVAEVPPPPPPPAAMPMADTTTMLAEVQAAAEPRAIPPATARQEAKEEGRARSLPAQPERKVAQKAGAGAATATAPGTKHQAPSTQNSAQIGSVSGGVVESSDTAAVSEAIVVTAEAPAAPPRPASLPEPGAAIVTESQADAALATAQNGRRVSTSLAAARLQRPVTATAVRPFGISTDPSVVGKLKKSIERGDPPPKQIDVAAVVNHFAGAPAGVDDVRLQVEASQAPLKADGTAVIRYTIDTPATLAWAEVSIALEEGVIATHRTIGGARSLEAATGSLRAGQSATGLVELKLRPGTPEGQRVATVILKYISPVTKQRVRVATDIRAESLNLTWAAASRRHRLATLSAAWGESLSSAQVVDELILTAARLAKEAPADPLAQELATVTASSRPRSSGPTGSGG